MKKRIVDVRTFQIEPEKKEICFSFNNGRHHAVVISNGDSRDKVVRKLRKFTFQLEADELLNSRSRPLEEKGD